MAGTKDDAAEMEEWDQVGQFKVPISGWDGATGIAVLPDGNLVVVDWGSKVQVMSRSGDVIHTLKVEAKDVNLTSNGFAIPDKKQNCKVYDTNFKVITDFKTQNASNQESMGKGITVDKNGCIILAMQGAISIYKADGAFNSSFAIPYEPDSIAVTSENKIIVVDCDKGLQVFKGYFSGKKPLTPFAAPPDIEKWQPKYVCCSTKDEVFISNDGKPNGVYKFAASGEYVGCVTTDVTDPRGIALSSDDQELFVVEMKSHMVKLFERP